MKNNVLRRIKEGAAVLSPKQMHLANYILSNYQEVSFMSSAELARAASVGESTVIRLAVSLGYSGYSAFQDSLQEFMQKEISTLDRFTVAEVSDESTIYQKVFSKEVNMINKALKEIDKEKFDKVTQLLSEKENLIIIGLQGTRCLAEYAGYSFNKIRPNVFKFYDVDEYAYNFFNTVDGDTVALVFCFTRYPRKTISAMKIFKHRGIPVIVVTDSIVSPATRFADLLITIPQKNSFIDCHAANMCLINAVCLGTAYRDQKKTRIYLERFEEYAKENNIFLQWAPLSKHIFPQIEIE
ncbi:MAG: MurR/RpiR family transcriptional regulator [Veillonellales bacterium]